MAGLRLWIGASTADAGVRLAAQMLSTVVVARLLPPEDFGIALMVLSVIAVVSAFIGLPFEELLAQRRRITMGHVELALFVSLLMAGAALAIVLLSAPFLGRITGVPELSFWLPVATAFLLAEGPGAIVRALCRRYQRFVDLSISQSVSVLIASALSIGLAFAGYGVIVLILQRMLPVLLFPLLALVLARRRAPLTLVRPAWHPARFGELFRFSWLHLTDVGFGAAIPALAAYVINGLYGTIVLGHLNIALRIVDPLRQLIGGIGHNLVFSILARLQHDPERLGRAAGDIVANVGALAIPAFLGIAACAPTLLPLLVGPGWEDAIMLSQALSIAAAVYVPFGFLYSGFSALGRPEYGLVGTAGRGVVMLGGLALLHEAGIGETGIGLVMILSDLALALLAIGFLFHISGTGSLTALLRVCRIYLAAIAMAGITAYLWYTLAPISQPVLQLVAIAATGALLYAALLLLFCRSCFATLRVMLLSRS